MKTNVLEMTDAGPGVAVGNLDVRLGIAAHTRIHNIDHYGHIHLARDNNGKKETERSNAAIGNSIVDGGPLEWDYYQPFNSDSEAQ